METGSSQLMQVLLLRTTLWELRMWMVYSILTESQKETHFSRVCVCCYFSRVWSTLCDPVGCNPPGSPVHGIFPARILEWVAISFSRGSSWPRDRTHVFCISCTSDEFFTAELLGKPSWVQEALITIESSQRELAMIWGSNSNLDKPI